MAEARVERRLAAIFAGDIAREKFVLKQL